MCFLTNKFVFRISPNMAFLKVTFGFAVVLNVCVFYSARSDKIHSEKHLTSLYQQLCHVSTLGIPSAYWLSWIVACQLDRSDSHLRGGSPCWFSMYVLQIETVSSCNCHSMHCTANTVALSHCFPAV